MGCPSERRGSSVAYIPPEGPTQKIVSPSRKTNSSGPLVGGAPQNTNSDREGRLTNPKRPDPESALAEKGWDWGMCQEGIHTCGPSGLRTSAYIEERERIGRDEVQGRWVPASVGWATKCAPGPHAWKAASCPRNRNRSSPCARSPVALQNTHSSLPFLDSVEENLDNPCWITMAARGDRFEEAAEAFAGIVETTAEVLAFEIRLLVTPPSFPSIIVIKWRRKSARAAGGGGRAEPGGCLEGGRPGRAAEPRAAHCGGPAGRRHRRPPPLPPRPPARDTRLGRRGQRRKLTFLFFRPSQIRDRSCFL